MGNMEVNNTEEKEKEARIMKNIYASLSRKEAHILNIIGYIFIKCGITRHEISGKEIVKYTRQFLKAYKYGKKD